MASAWLALVGTIVGAALSYAFQRLSAGRSEGFVRAEQLRASRLEAYSAYAAALMNWRRSQLVRALMNPDEHAADAALVIAENRIARTEAWSAFYRVKLLCDDATLEMLARSALVATREMKRERERARLDALGDEVRHKVDQFLDAAAMQTVRRL